MLRRLLTPSVRSLATQARPRMDHSLAYTPERGEELKANLAEVLKEIDEAKPAGSSVSLTYPPHLPRRMVI